MPRSTSLMAAVAVVVLSSAPTTGHGAQPAAPARPVITLESVTDAVLADAASRTGLGRTALVVQSAESVTWADGSLGCPTPGASYTMAQVPGFRVRVRAGEQVLDYHADRRGHFILCPAQRAVDPAGALTS